MQPMKKIWCATTVVLMFCVAELAAAQDEVAEGRAMVQAARDEIIRSELYLGDDEMAAFWPVYEEYTATRNVLMDRYTDMISEYIRRYDNADFSDEYADKLIRDFFEIKRARLDLRESYVAKFKEVLPVLKVAQFYQLENKIDADIDSQLAISVPLIE
jgi:hypothetical protein